MGSQLRKDRFGVVPDELDQLEQDARERIDDGFSSCSLSGQELLTLVFEAREVRALRECFGLEKE